MNIKQAKYHLKRIQTILDLQDTTLSELDRNILLEDIKKLYELIIFSGESPEKPVEKEIDKSSAGLSASAPENQSPPATPVREPSQPAPAPEKIIVKTQESLPIAEEIPAPSEGEPISAPAHLSAEPEPSTDSTPVLPHPSTTEPPAQQPLVQTSSAPAEQSESNGRESETTVLTQKNDHQYPDLFDFHSSDDLSERLGNSKVDQLNQILAINDKILYINHLFGGEAIPFQESLKRFESFYTYEEAKSYAAQELVEKYQWTDQNKRDTVRQFMKQVRRLY